MPETVDKRRRSDLDVFLIALIESGVTSPYQLQRTAGISQGASTPALQRLLASGFVRQASSGPRGRSDYKVTASGRRTLNSSWAALVQEGPSGDLDSDLRVALLAIWGGMRREASQFLTRAAERTAAATAIGEQEGSPDVAPLAYWYSKLRRDAAHRQVKVQSTALLAIAESLPKAVRPKPTQQASRRRNVHKG